MIIGEVYHRLMGIISCVYLGPLQHALTPPSCCAVRGMRRECELQACSVLAARG